ncbi:MFS transporter [Paracoccus benzoatiresistens]|uniref:MFS transporter n=1 Tax=Paracoccus benzoatiresistens TaxID=2997341 RepID=A0ABT4J8P5_9RHOB|nr:MFS transporter [Paracoccus sp. EF6]MCZ0962801.1 MFS transporter [Paracoccus sp. EF6]
MTPMRTGDAGFNPWLATVLLLLGNFMNLIDVSIVNVALPSIQQNLNATAAQIEWVSAAYVLAFAAGLLPFGRFGDKFGRKRLFLQGIGLFTLASALCGFAQDMSMLIWSRALQGIGGAMMVPQVLAIMHVMFAPEQKARAFALAGVVASLGAVTGPLLGGALITGNIAGLDWRPIFLVNLPVGLFVIAAGLRWIPVMSSDRRMRIDWIGIALFSLAVLLIVLPVIEGALLGWPWWCVAMLAAALPVGALFVWRQAWLARRKRAQLLPVALMRNGGFLSGVAMVMLHFSAIPGMFLVLALYLQTGFGLDPMQSGIATAPFPLGIMLGSYVTGRFGTRVMSWRMAAGVSIMLAGMIFLRHVSGHPPQALTAATLAAPLAVCGFGMGLTISPLFQTVLKSVPAQDAGAGSGAMQAFQQVGAATGIAIVSSLFFVRLHGQGGDYAAAMSHALIYQICAFSAILVILAARGVMRGRAEPPRREAVSGR